MMGRRIHRRRTLGIGLGVVVLTALGAAPAGAAYKIDRARFKVKLTATQTTTWSVNRRDPFEICGVTTVGSGKQTIDLVTNPAVSVFVLQAYNTAKPREHQPLTFFGPFLYGTIAAKGTIDTQGTSKSTPNSDQPCGDGGDGGPPPAPPAPDCGRRSFTGYLGLDYHPVGSWFEDPAPLTGVLTLDGLRAGVPRYKNCPGADDRLLLTPNSSLTVKKVMGTTRRFTVRGHDTEVNNAEGSHSETTLNWKATFTRVAVGNPPRPPAGSGGVCDDNQDNDNDGLVDDQDPDCYRTNGRSEG